MYNVSKFQPQIHYILGYMIFPSKDSSLFQDSSLNKTLGENCDIASYKDPNEVLQDLLDREQTVLSMVKVLDHDDEMGTLGILYKFAMLNSP